MFRFKHNPEGSRWSTKLALAAATALLAFALVVSAGTSALQTESAFSMGFVQLVQQKAASVYVSAQTFVNVLRVVRSTRFGAEALEANPAKDSLLESEVQRCSDSLSEKPSTPATTQS